MNIIGISAFYHDSAVALIQDGKIVYASQEERFTRKKHDFRFPTNAFNDLLEKNSLTPEDIDHVVFYEKPFLKFDRLMSTYMQFAPFGIKSFIKAMPVWFKEKLFIKSIIYDKTKCKSIKFVKHHESHAASAFFPSPFEEAAVITLDGVGEWDTLTVGSGKGSKIELKKTLKFPNSLGLLYSAFTYFCGFRVNSGEYKLMGLAPYGEPKYTDKIIENLMDLKEDGSFCLDLNYFNYHTGLTMTSKKFDTLFGAEPRKAETALRQIDMDLAASIQKATEIIMEKIVITAKKEIGGDNLVLAGGVALNCVANGKVLKKQIFKNVWIQPASGDAGGALGAALMYWYNTLGNKRISPNNIDDSQSGSFLGPEYSSNEIEAYLKSKDIRYKKLENNEKANVIANLIKDQKVIGLFNGRMEFGPRALGHRSIIGDARSEEMQKIMNVNIKFRESFRPFAPSVLEENVNDYFDFDYQSRYMLLVYDVLKDKRSASEEDINKIEGLDKLNVIKSTVPAITHVDFSSRVHTVNKKFNPFYYEVISEFNKLTGCPVIINTSFNVRGEPIVNTPDNAYQCFLHTNMDYLLLEDYLIEKLDSDKIDITDDWLKKFPLD